MGLGQRALACVSRLPPLRGPQGLAVGELSWGLAPAPRKLAFLEPLGAAFPVSRGPDMSARRPAFSQS